VPRVADALITADHPPWPLYPKAPIVGGLSAQLGER